MGRRGGVNVGESKKVEKKAREYERKKGERGYVVSRRRDRWS